MIRIVLLALTLAVGLPATASGQTALLERGQKVYAAERCALCHSIGTTGNQRGPLDNVGNKLSADEVREWMVDAPGMTKKTKSERRPLMRSYPNLSDEDMAALVAYMLSLKTKE